MVRVAPLVLLPLMAGCSTMVPRTADLSPAGQTLRVVSRGSESQMVFRANGDVVATAGGRSFTGQWNMQEEGLCFRWGQAPIECWPYSGQFEQGRTVTVTSTRGNVLQITRL